MVPVTQTENHFVAQGLFTASYADFGELKFDSADQNHHYIVIDPSVTNQIKIREVNRAQWITLSGQVNATDQSATALRNSLQQIPPSGLAKRFAHP